jgi:ureidoacrylate peracid hydrolase
MRPCSDSKPEETEKMTVMSRNDPVTDAARLGLLVVDVQYYVAKPGQGEYSHLDPQAIPEDLRYYFDRIERTVLPNIRCLQQTVRDIGGEVLFTTVENLTDDGRDRSLDYKLSGIDVKRGSRDAQVLEEIAPVFDEIRFPKTTSSVFNSTNIEFVLRNLGITHLIVVGLLTDQCVISAVRDACDRGFVVIVPEDACATYTHDRHEWALKLTAGYCRLVVTDSLNEELKKIGPE